ncbi:hypothetical protein P9112_007716 [Eukaryota sp. TZLM1-RC]
MSDIFQQDIFDPNPRTNMQQEPATHIHNKEVKDERVDEVPLSSAMEEVTRTDPVPSPLKRKEETDEVTRTDPAPSPLKAMEEVTRTDTDPLPSQFQNLSQRERMEIPP